MIADDMMSYIKSDIVVFEYGCICIDCTHSLVNISEISNGVVMPLMGCAASCNSYDGIAWD